MGKVTKDLIQEHDVILHALELLKKVQAREGLEEDELLQYYGEFAYFSEVFADKCHHGKEEHNMYHTLAPLGDTAEKNMIIALIEDHVKARALVRELKAAVEAGNVGVAAVKAAEYRALLLDHIRRENEEMFPSLEHRITDKQQDVMYGHFLDVEARFLGDGVKERLDAMIKGWEAMAA